MNVFRRLSIRFSDNKMEKAYTTLKEESLTKDFHIFIILMLIIAFTSLIFSGVKKRWVELYISTTLVAILLIILVIQKYIRKYLQIVTLLLVFLYNTWILLLIKIDWSNPAKLRMFYLGYGGAMLQGLLILRLARASYRAFAMAVALIARFSIIYAFNEPKSYIPFVFVRHLLVDVFIIYTIFNYEKAFRKIYQDFNQKKEELLKFKELLAESLPQSLAVVRQTEAPELLFCNNAFQDTFDDSSCSLQASANDVLKTCLEFLSVEQSTIREAGTNNTNWTSLNDLDEVINLRSVLRKFCSEDSISRKAIFLTASIFQKGDKTLFEITLKKVKWDHEDAVAILFNDITYQEKLIALKLANINKDKVIATVSHELRTPLNGIIGILDIAQKKVNDPEIAEHLWLCKGNAHILLSVVNSMLDLQQISTGTLRLNPVKINIRETIKDIKELFSFQCKEKCINIEGNIEEDVPKHVITDENRLKQILINLLGNAVKFTSQGKIGIEVTLNTKNVDKIQITVSDTGVGIKEEDQGRLFKMYSKIEDKESVNKNGAGFGLTISNSLVIFLNGDLNSSGIQVKTEYGKGSKFYFDISIKLKTIKQEQELKKGPQLNRRNTIHTVSNRSDSETTNKILLHNLDESKKIQADREDDSCSFEAVKPKDFEEFLTTSDLPFKMKNGVSFKRPSNSKITTEHSNKELLYSEGDEKGEANLHSSTEKRNLQAWNQIAYNFHILIVDDNPFNLLVATNLTKELGCKVKTALSGQEAIEVVRKSHSEGIVFRVILMDCQMPVMDGFETTKALKIMMNNREIPEIPILAWTANNSEEDMKRCFEVGMTGYLPKPASKSDIMEAISDLEGPQTKEL